MPTKTCKKCGEEKTGKETTGYLFCRPCRAAKTLTTKLRKQTELDTKQTGVGCGKDAYAVPTHQLADLVDARTRELNAIHDTTLRADSGKHIGLGSTAMIRNRYSQISGQRTDTTARKMYRITHRVSKHTSLAVADELCLAMDTQLVMSGLTVIPRTPIGALEMADIWLRRENGNGEGIDRIELAFELLDFARRLCDDPAAECDEVVAEITNHEPNG